MKKSVILCFVASCLLSAFPGNEGSKLKDSLYCVMEYPGGTVTCSWSESRNSTQFVNMSLAYEDGNPVCDYMEPVEITPTHLNWTCHKKGFFNLHYNLKLAFIPDRSLESRLNVAREGDDAKPKDLRCQASGRMINCSWRVRQEVVDSVDFTLYYQNVYGKEEAFQPICWQEIPPYLSCACNFTANDNHSIHNISVRPTNPETSYKEFVACQHVTLRPMNITVKEISKGKTFEINWKIENKLTDFKYHYEACYWRQNDIKPNEVSFDCLGVSKTLSTSEMRFRLGKELNSGSNYSVKVRVRVAEKDPKTCYNGPWSEWSNVQTFHTKSDLHILLLCFLVISAVVVFVICAVCGCRALVRYKKKWEAEIPSPCKSSIVKGLQAAKDSLVTLSLTLQNGPSFPHEDHFCVEPYNKVLLWPLSKEDTNLLKQDEEQITRPDSEFLQDDDTQCLRLFKMTLEEAPTASPTTEYTPFSELIKEQENRSMENCEVTICDFDGPYLFS
ncbi:hypothetical protein PRIEUP_LOCUS594 [Pristimantis euphronides]